MTTLSPRHVARMLMIFFGALLLIAALRLVWIQAVRGGSLRQEAEDARVMPRSTPAQRGGIYDRDGVALALSSTVYDVIADPANLYQKGRAAKMLADVLEGDADDYYEKLTRPTHYTVLMRGISQAQRDMLVAYIDDLPTQSTQQKEFKQQMKSLIVFELDYERHYPADDLAAQTLGWVRIDTGEGQGGIELQYDALLRGKPGSSTSERDVFGNLIPSGVQKEVPAQAGQSIILTIDYHVQAFVDRIIAEEVKTHDAKAGAAIVMDVKTGELLAVSSYPTFDLNKYNLATEEQFRNRALIEMYEPGSTLKPITAAAALESGHVDTQTTFEVPTSLDIGPDTISDDVEHGTWLHATLGYIVERSSNVGTTKVAFRIGRQALYTQYRNVGFLGVPDTDFPALAPAALPEPEDWLDIALSNHSFGQGLAISPLMLTRSVASIANGGTLVTPHLLKEAPGKPSLTDWWPTSSAMSSQTAQEVTAMMENVMINGTGSSIHLEGYRVAGKTGTAQKAAYGQGYDTDAYIGSFIGFFPVEDPQIIIYIMIDEPGGEYYGARVAGPAFSAIAEFAAEHFQIPPSQ